MKLPTVLVTICGILQNSMYLDVEIFMNKIVKFFRENPNELYNLIPTGKEDDFFKEIRKKSIENVDEGSEATLTQKQMIEVCVKINSSESESDEKKSKIFVDTLFGKICLN